MLLDVEVPTPGPGQVLVRVAWSTISPGTEITQLRMAPRGLASRLRKERGAVEQGLRRLRQEGLQYGISVLRQTDIPPVPLGYSCAGEICAVGDQVREYRVGQRVACGGPGFANHAEFVAMPQTLLVPVPDQVDLREASSVALGGIALQALRRADARLGETIAVFGLGYIGHLIAQALHSAGVRVLAVDPRADRLERAAAFLEHRCAYNCEDSVEELVEVYGDLGIDTVIVTAGEVASSLQAAAEVVRPRGRIVQVGVGDVTLSRREFWLKELDVVASRSYGPGFREAEYEAGHDYPSQYVRWTLGRNYAEYLRQLERGRMDAASLVDREVALSDAPEAYRLLEEDQPPLGVVLRYPQS